MLTKIKSVLQDQFIRASILFSFVNLLVSAIAFVIPVLVSREGGELINDWLALNGVITVFLTLAAGFALYYAKTISRIAQKNPVDSESYLVSSVQFLHKTALRYGWIVIVVLLVFAAFLKFLNWYQAIIIAVAVYTELWATIYRSYFLGRLEYNSAMFLVVTAAVTRFVGIVGLLYAGYGVNALVFGTVIGSLLAVAVGVWYTRGVFKTKDFEVAKDFLSSTKASAALIMGAVLLQAGQIVTQGLFNPNEKEVLTTVSMLNFFGSILFYGASAFLALFVVNATRSSSVAIYRKASIIIALVSVLGVIAIAILWNPALHILRRTEYLPLLPQFLLFSIFMILYNMFFVSVQFLISQYKYKEILQLGGIVVATVLILVLNALVTFTHSNYIPFYIGILITSGVFAFGYSYYLVVSTSNKT